MPLRTRNLVAHLLATAFLLGSLGSLSRSRKSNNVIHQSLTASLAILTLKDPLKFSPQATLLVDELTVFFKYILRVSLSRTKRVAASPAICFVFVAPQTWIIFTSSNC